KRRDAKTRSEVIETVKGQLSGLGEMRSQIDALTLAVGELDFLVRRTTSLHWQGGFLAVDVPRTVAGDPQRAVNAALEHLRSSVYERRSELRAEQVLVIFANLISVIRMPGLSGVRSDFEDNKIEQFSAFGITSPYLCAAELYIWVDYNRAYQH